MNKPHPHEKVILAYYRGEQIQVWREQRCDLPVYVPDSRAATCPNFNPNGGYRIKPVTVGVTLDMAEIETLWAVLQYVGGDPQTTARRHVDSVMGKLEECISDERKEQLEEWGGVEDFQEVLGFKITANLP